MKTLSLLTLALHFTAVMLLVGSLVAVTWWSLSGRLRKNATELSSAHVLARRLPTLMTYVINLGVPPLLFAQVLYGRAIYTSSVLIAASWISVIAMLLVAYRLLYIIPDRLQAGKSAFLASLVAFLMVIGIGRIYSLNMTLMLRPEVWQSMYAASDQGIAPVPADPTITYRWLFVMFGGVIFGGAWMLLLANMKHLESNVVEKLRKTGVGFVVAGAIPQLFFAYQTRAAQDAKTLETLASYPIAMTGGYIYLLTTLAVAGLTLAMFKKASLGLAIANVVAGFLQVTGMTLYRDGIRDAVLAQKGFSVFERTEVSNWSVIAIFLVLFVIGLALVFWLAMVMKGAKPLNESVPVEPISTDKAVLA